MGYIPSYSIDTLRVIQNAGSEHTSQEVAMADFRIALETVTEGPQVVRKDVTLDLTTLGAKFMNAFNTPAGGILFYAALKILVTVVAGGTTVKLGLGPNGSSTNKYGLTGDLLAGTQIQNLYNGSSSLASQETFDVNAVTTAGSALGDTNVSAGKVRVVAEYYIPAALN